MTATAENRLPHPEGVEVRAIDDTEISNLVRNVVCTAPGRLPSETPEAWCLAELTDGRLTGVCIGGTWALSIDEFGADGPKRLERDGEDWWRLRSLRVFNDDAETVITGDDGTLFGVELKDRCGAPAESQPRDRSLLVTSGTEGSPNPSTGGRRYPPGTVKKTLFARMTNPAHRTFVVPGPFDEEHGLTVARLTVREYFAQTPTGAVGVRAHRLVRFGKATP